MFSVENCEIKISRNSSSNRKKIIYNILLRGN